MRSLIVFGTRPEAIKLAPLAKTAPPNTFIFYTNQQGDMGLRTWNSFISIRPILGMQSQDPNDIMLSMFDYQTQIRELIREKNIDVVICQGDTLTAFAAAGAAFFERIPLAHVEAGLTTGNYFQPFPEEIFRNMIDTLSTFLFAPTKDSFSRIQGRKYGQQYVHLVGNTIVDALLMIGRMRSAQAARVIDNLRWVSLKPLILITMHRRESFGQPVIDFVKSIKSCIETLDYEFVIIRHPNPALSIIDTELGQMNYPNLQILDSLDYSDMYGLLKSVDAIISDSGGLQEEALLLSIPILITREVTERPEVIDAGLGKLLYPDHPEFTAEMSQFIRSIVRSESERSVNLSTVLGDGKASKYIWSRLEQYFSDNRD